MALKSSEQSDRHGELWYDEHGRHHDAASLHIWGALALVCLTIWLVVGFAAWFYLIR